MIIVRIQEGLGNQMFQYAFAKGMSASTGQDFALDIAAYAGGKTKHTNREYGLGKFGLLPTIAIPETIQRFLLDATNPVQAHTLRASGQQVPRFILEWQFKRITAHDGISLDADHAHPLVLI